MGLRGRHRRYKASRINRASLTVTAGGATVALPLVGGGPAQAAEPGALAEPAALDPAALQLRPAAADFAARTAVRPETTPQSRAGKAELYTVVRGDSLSAIADAEDVEGGWKGLYAANRKLVGADPDLIVPGQRLRLHGGGTTVERTTERAEENRASREHSKPKQTSEPKQTSKPKQASKPKPASEQQASASRSGGLSAPVAASPSTPYRASGGSWASGYHTGVDFAVPTGTSVRAVAGGRVVSAGWGGAYGYEVVIRHADGRYSQYAHLSALSVRAGQDVGAGQRIARSGSTGNSTGPHLHFEIRTGPGYGSDVDPLAYLRAGGVRL
ncbi:peptidoglycan DD-metalloendopeptidase family protein [Streptomyces sp. Da 82-17]|uniref:M23 family metallopeptidase n=1 Tax=Streptomyces sp. Da 82-17 TaxID=3377116 RepID=UPI0038D440CD